MSKPILDQINLVCGDLDTSIAFYRRLGVEIPDARVWRTMGYVFMYPLV
jgi:catechol 2,3-dioxygenase-like lactoylglutathione lyase family enzyme